jgi:hypothetical protein
MMKHMRKRKRNKLNDAAYPTCAFVCEENPFSPNGADLFVVFDGQRIARRGYPGTPQAKQWIPLVLGVKVTDTDNGNGLIVEPCVETAGCG